MDPVLIGICTFCGLGDGAFSGCWHACRIGCHFDLQVAIEKRAASEWHEGGALQGLIRVRRIPLSFQVDETTADRFVAE